MLEPRKLIPNTEIINLLKNKGEVNVFDKKIMGSLDINESVEINCDAIIFFNCEVDRVTFNEISLKLGIKFYHCELETLELKNTSINGFNASEYSQYSIDITDTKIKENFTIYNSTFERGLEISLNSEISVFRIEGVYFANGSIDICDSTIDSMCDFNWMSLRDIRFENSIIKSQVRLSSVDCSGYTFLKSTFKRDLQIWGGQAEHNITFNNGIYEDDVIITSVRSNGILTVSGDEFKTKLTVNYIDDTNKIQGGCQEIYLDSCSFGNGAYFNGTDETIDPYPIRKLNIVSSEKLSGGIELNNFFISETSLTGSNINGNIKFDRIDFNTLEIKDFRNSSTLQFFGVLAPPQHNSKLIISKSNLGSAEFYNTDLKSFKKIYIRNAILSDIIASNVIWFTKEHIEPLVKNRELLENDWKNNRETWRQLKYAMEKQGNKIKSLDFKSYEMECFRNELNLQYYSKGLIGNRFILWLSQSNDFGLNFLKPLILSIIAALICYCFIVVGISHKLSFTLGGGCEDIKSTCNEFKNYFYGFFKMFNPVYDFNKAFKIKDDESIHWGVSFIDMFYRLILSYLIFQLITAFRKFVK